MEIKKDMAVSIHYTLKDIDGKVLDTSENNEPLKYLHGYGQMIPGVENSLEGKKIGDSLEVTVEPKDGYGEYDERLIAKVEKAKINADIKLEAGMPLQAETGEGVHVLYVKKIEGEDVYLDGNHPLAGIPLHFSLSVVDVQEATEEEKQHGHAH
ncbi:MAG: peptidylprolyl isomerase [Spirochaetales bacterium]|nr:peptidylprolyl isomerase [Spirochaetales bacterium]